MHEINQTERFTINPEIMYTFIDQETIIISTIDDKMFGLNELATELLKQMEDSAVSIHDLVNYVLNHYEVSEEQCREDVTTIMESLVADQLIISQVNPAHHPE
ncbi:MAG: PqqD family protein [Legionella sp.]|jgi:hypothetical protein